MNVRKVISVSKPLTKAISLWDRSLRVMSLSLSLSLCFVGQVMPLQSLGLLFEGVLYGRKYKVDKLVGRCVLCRHEIEGRPPQCNVW